MKTLKKDAKMKNIEDKTTYITNLATKLLLMPKLMKLKKKFFVLLT